MLTTVFKPWMCLRCGYMMHADTPLQRFRSKMRGIPLYYEIVGCLLVIAFGSVLALMGFTNVGEFICVFAVGYFWTIGRPKSTSVSNRPQSDGP